MKKDISKELDNASLDYVKILKSETSRSSALKSIAAKAVSDFGEFITPGNLNVTDEIHINLVELLDQIIYEFSDSSNNNSPIRDYIIDDLYSKLSLTLEALTDIDNYLTNIRNRSLFPDDMIIIRNRQLSSMIPLLIAESKGITNLQKEIIKTFLYFNDEALLEYYYNSFKSNTSGFIKSAALLGLKYNSDNKLNWNTIREKGHNSNDLSVFAEKFNLNSITSNMLPSSKEELTFTLLHIEKYIKNFTHIDSVRWIISLLILIPSFDLDNSWLYEVNSSVSSILLKINVKTLNELLKDEYFMIDVMKFIDLLPGNFFDRLTGRFDQLGVEFLYNLNSAIEKKKIVISRDNSNLLNYLCWNSIESF